MLPVIYDMEIYRGDAFSKRLRFTSDGVPEDLTGKPVLAQIRTSTELTAKLVATCKLFICVSPRLADPEMVMPGA